MEVSELAGLRYSSAVENIHLKIHFQKMATNRDGSDLAGSLLVREQLGLHAGLGQSRLVLDLGTKTLSSVEMELYTK